MKVLEVCLESSRCVVITVENNSRFVVHKKLPSQRSRPLTEVVEVLTDPTAFFRKQVPLESVK